MEELLAFETTAFERIAGQLEAGIHAMQNDLPKMIRDEIEKDRAAQRVEYAAALELHQNTLLDSTIATPCATDLDATHLPEHLAPVLPLSSRIDAVEAAVAEIRKDIVQAPFAQLRQEMEASLARLRQELWCRVSEIQLELSKLGAASVDPFSAGVKQEEALGFASAFPFGKIMVRSGIECIGPASQAFLHGFGTPVPGVEASEEAAGLCPSEQGSSTLASRSASTSGMGDSRSVVDRSDTLESVALASNESPTSGDCSSGQRHRTQGRTGRWHRATPDE